ncbi:hypothetical protein JNJ66_04805 [Candidatus Saccharibacteria bacterium]|nr:hypothetical protein [Candidatus Saccharibacteria bacterium]
MSLWGFSLGAMISLLASAERPLDTLTLCSPSGYFKEYMPLIAPEFTGWCTLQQLAEFQTNSLMSLLERTHVRRAAVLAGDQELAAWPTFREAVSDIHQSTGWPLRIIANTHHDIDQPGYRQELQSVITSL